MPIISPTSPATQAEHLLELYLLHTRHMNALREFKATAAEPVTTVGGRE